MSRGVLSRGFVTIARVALSTVLVTPLAACRSPAEPSPRPVEEGVWGGLHAVLHVDSLGARLELDCAHGEVEGPLMLDRSGRFERAGVYVIERPGPVIPGQAPDRHPARFSGAVEGRVMTLTVTPIDDAPGPGTFRLTLGSPGQIMKCL